MRLNDVDRDRARLRRLLRSADTKLLNRRPPNGDWSILENVRHLLFAEQLHLGGFLSDGFEWSRLGMTGMTAKKFATVGRRATKDLGEVLAEWDAIHRPIRAAVKLAEGPDVERALWRNHRHLRIHIEVIERLLRKFGAEGRRLSPVASSSSTGSTANQRSGLPRAARPGRG
jgi:hypothetical protein